MRRPEERQPDFVDRQGLSWAGARPIERSCNTAQPLLRRVHEIVWKSKIFLTVGRSGEPVSNQRNSLAGKQKREESLRPHTSEVVSSSPKPSCSRTLLGQ